MGKYVFNPATGTMELVSSVDLPKKNEVNDDSEKVSINDIISKEPLPVIDLGSDEDIVAFRAQRDLTKYEIIDKDTGIVLGYISGYALDFQFKTKELNSTAKVEQFLNGVKSLFRNMIVEKLLKK